MNETAGYTHDENRFAMEARRLREERGWTLAQMAARLQVLDVDNASAMTVSRIEKLQRHVTMMESQAYAIIFDRTVSAIMHPDGRESIFLLFRDSEHSSRRDFVSFKDATKRFFDDQEAVRGHIEAVEDLYRNRDGVDPETDSMISNYLLNARNLVDIDIVWEVRKITGQSFGFGQAED